MQLNLLLMGLVTLPLKHANPAPPSLRVTMTLRLLLLSAQIPSPQQPTQLWSTQLLLLMPSRLNMGPTIGKVEAGTLAVGVAAAGEAAGGTGTGTGGTGKSFNIWLYGCRMVCQPFQSLNLLTDIVAAKG